MIKDNKAGEGKTSSTSIKNKKKLDKLQEPMYRVQVRKNFIGGVHGRFIAGRIYEVNEETYLMLQNHKVI